MQEWERREKLAMNTVNKPFFPFSLLLLLLPGKGLTLARIAASLFVHLLCAGRELYQLFRKK